MSRRSHRSLYTLKKYVEDVMIESYESRDDDKLLYYLVCKKIAAERNIDVDYLSFKAVMTNPNLDLPSSESVTRCRRKIQETDPTMYGDKASERAERIEEFIDFARHG